MGVKAGQGRDGRGAGTKAASKARVTAGRRSYRGQAASTRQPRRRIPAREGGRPRGFNLAVTRKLLGVLSLLVVVGLGCTLFLTSAAFGVREIVVVGSVHLTSAEIVRLCGVTLGSNIFKISTSAIRERLEAEPRVAQAAVGRKLPSTLTVNIVEREGVILVPCQERFAEIDQSGVPVELHSYIGALGLPIVTGVSLEGLTLGTRLPDEKLSSALFCAVALGPVGRAEVAEIHQESSGNLILYTRDGLPVYFGPATGLDAKVSALLGILADIEDEGLDVTYVDVQYPRYPVIGSAGGPAEPEEWIDPDVVTFVED